jgi:hypothetical protein
LRGGQAGTAQAEVKSTHELRKERIQKQVAALEAEAMADKQWKMAGAPHSPPLCNHHSLQRLNVGVLRHKMDTNPELHSHYGLWEFMAL